ncbi:MAG: hypothetical protein IJ461_08685, partial [Clostridia bacterium]|nr:hypothetical protein [Clostridia bacterium]
MFPFISVALAEEAEPTAVSRFLDLGTTGWITLVTLVVLALVIIGMSVTRKQWTAKALAYAALSVALGFVLSFVKLFEM